MTTPAPFRERLVWFWTNHFVVSLRRGECTAVAAAFVEEAIRPNIAGPFGDMILAVMRHPAMLLYLDNATSFGPDSPAGQRTHRGLNETLARESLELHTVSPAAGYTQADVTSFANILTGWSIDLKADPPGFRYRPFAHQPGRQTLLQQSFPPGEAGGAAALAFLASHPATHRFLATKLVRHFVADDPPPEAMRQIEANRRPRRHPVRRIHPGPAAPAGNPQIHRQGRVSARCYDAAVDQSRIPEALIRAPHPPHRPSRSCNQFQSRRSGPGTGRRAGRQTPGGGHPARGTRRHGRRRSLWRPGLAGLRGELVPPEPNQPDGLLDLGGFFGLHPALAGLHDMYKGK